MRAEREANKTFEDKLNEAIKGLEETKKSVSMQIANFEKFIPASEDRDEAILALKNVIKSKENEVESLRKQAIESSRGTGTTKTSGS